jgi:hypothetical protein
MPEFRVISRFIIKRPAGVVEPPLKPRCALRIGVVGNRRFGGEKDAEPTAAASVMKSCAAAAMTALWKVLFDSILRVLDTPLTEPGPSGSVFLRDLFDDGVPRVAVLSSLAAGSDQIGAQTARNLIESRIFVELEAVLPFSEADYPGLPGAEQREFREDEAKTLRTLAAKASQVIRLDGRYDHSPLEGYRQARDLLLENSDLLVAIYDPRQPGGEAGARETVGQALETGTPVITVLVEENEARINVRRDLPQGVQAAGAEWDAAIAVDDARWRPLVEHCVAEQLLPPEVTAAAAGHPEALDRALYRLNLISRAALPPRLCRLEKWFGAVWRRLLELAGATEPSPDFPSAAITLQPYAGLYRRTEELAGMYMATYRGAFVLSYVLASLAVAAAVALMAASLLAHGHPSLWTVIPLCVSKVLILGLLLWLEREGRIGRLQEAGVEFRYLAELLRPMQWLARAGTSPPAVDLPVHAAQHDPRRSWMVWLARATARSASFVGGATPQDPSRPREVSMNAATAASALERAGSEWLEGQVLYHATNARRMRTLEHALERWAKQLLWTVLAAAVAACALELALHFERVPELYESSAFATAVILGAIAAVLPALIAALAGIAFQSEAKRLATRSHSMEQNLRAEQGRLARAAGAVGSVANEAAASSTARNLLRRVSGHTIEEVGDWKVLYEVHEIHAG